MDLLQLLNGLVANIAALQAQLVDAQASADALAKAKLDEGFALGFEAGKASVVIPPSDKIYSQLEVDQKISEAIIPLQEQIIVLQAKVDGFPLVLDQEKAAAVLAFKAELLVKYEEKQVVESQAETGFADLLK